jgi:hypothetical protein
MKPDLIIIGQISLDHIVPAHPGAWYEALGGNALYAAAGARLWCDPGRIGIVARRGPNVPERIDEVLHSVGLTTAGLRSTPSPNMVEWLLYEPDGSRQAVERPPLGSVPPSAPGYLARKAAASAAAEDVPADWLRARAVHLAPQVLERHAISIPRLARAADIVSVDPSPTYTAMRSAAEISSALQGAAIVLPSRAEIEHLAPDHDFNRVGRAMVEAGIPEVVIKLGADGVLLCDATGMTAAVPAAPSKAVDFTGAGDAFCGGYLASRMVGMTPLDAARRGTISAAMVIECRGAEAALALDQECAAQRLRILA